MAHHLTSTGNAKAVLVAVSTAQQSKERTQEYLEELTFLAFTLGIETAATFVQNLEIPNVSTFIGKGKLEEIQAFIQTHPVDSVIFDDELSPSQVRNLEATLKCKVLDRSLLILNIFAMRAKTARAKTQVELAQYQYLLPRLTKMWTHLSRQKGGNTGMRGPGEKELETDRRIVQKKIALLHSKLAAIDRQSTTQRKQRAQFVRVALVGYTNVGKSTLMQLLSKADVQAENKLFATIGSTVRKVVIHNIPFLLTDTVGFIRKLPHTLIECFKSTLDEIREASLLLHVVDISHPAYEEQMQVVQDTLQDIGVTNVPTILVFNKIDCLQDLQQSGEDTVGHNPHIHTPHAQHSDQPAVFISAGKQQNIPALKAILYQQIKQQHLKIYPHYLTTGADESVPQLVEA